MNRWPAPWASGGPLEREPGPSGKELGHGHPGRGVRGAGLPSLRWLPGQCAGCPLLPPVSCVPPHAPLPALPHPGGSHPTVPQSLRSGSFSCGWKVVLPGPAVCLLGCDGRFPCRRSSWLSARGLHHCSAVSTTPRPERLSSALRKPGGGRCLPFVSSPGALQGRPWALAATSGAVSPPGSLDASLRLGSHRPLISPVSCSSPGGLELFFHWVPLENGAWSPGFLASL